MQEPLHTPRKYQPRAGTLSSAPELPRELLRIQVAHMKPSQLEACRVPRGARAALHNLTVPPGLETEQSLLLLPEQLYSIASLFFKGNQGPWPLEHGELQNALSLLCQARPAALQHALVHGQLRGQLCSSTGCQCWALPLDVFVPREPRTAAAAARASPGKADPNPSSAHVDQDWPTSTGAAAMPPSHLPGSGSGGKDVCGEAFPMSLSCSLRLTFRGFCLQNEQGHQYTTGMETAQVALDYSAWSHATRFTVQDPHSSLDLRSGIRNISPPIG